MGSKIILLGFLLLGGNVFSQTFLPQEGVLPFSGARFSRHGLGGEKLEILLNEDTWTSNRLPIDTDFDVKLVRPSGLKAADDGYYYPGVEILISNTKRDTLAYVPNIFGEETEGFDPETLKSLTVSLGFNEMSKAGDTCLLAIRFFDTQSDNSLLIDFPVVIADASLPLDVTNSTYSVSSTSGYSGIASGVEMSQAETSISSRELEIVLAELGELTEKEFRAGKSTVWLYDDKLDMKQVQSNVSVQTSKGKANLRVRTCVAANTRYVRFRWESKDRLKVIDFVSKA